MSTSYPGTIQSFTTIAGTTITTTDGHANRHNTTQDTVVALENTLGTTGGTSVLKSFSAGEFPEKTGKLTFGTNIYNLGTSNLGTSEYLAYNGTSIIGTMSSFSSPLTTKGDLFTYGTSDTRLPVGNDGQFPIADSSQTIGIKWSNTLTSPKINEDVSLTATSTELNKLHEIIFINGTWTSWTPTLTGITKGAGTLNCAYIQIGKIVKGRFSFILAADSAITGQIGFSLPVTSVSYPATATINTIGSGMFYDSSVSGYRATVQWLNTTTAYIFTITVSGSLLINSATSSTAPFTWATGDEIKCEFTYEAA